MADLHTKILQAHAKRGPASRLLTFLGLTDSNGWLSFTKVVIITILASYLAHRGVPPMVTAWCIAGAFGKSTLTALINRSNFETKTTDDVKLAAEWKHDETVETSTSTNTNLDIEVSEHLDPETMVDRSEEVEDAA